MKDKIEVAKAIELVINEQFKGGISTLNFNEISIPVRRKLKLDVEMQSHVDKLVREFINLNPNYTIWMKENTLKQTEGGAVNLNNLFTEKIRRN